MNFTAPRDCKYRIKLLKGMKKYQIKLLGFNPAYESFTQEYYCKKNK